MKVLSYILAVVIGFGAAFAVLSLADAPSNGQEFTAVDSNLTEEVGEGYGSYYSQLTDYQKQLYDVLLPTIAKAETSILLKNANIPAFKANVFKVVVAIHYDHPEYFWFRGGYAASFQRQTFQEIGNITMEPVYYEYVTSFFNANKKAEELEQEVKKVAELAKNHSDKDYERMMFVHDYLIEHADYDKAGLEEFYKTSHNPSCEYIFSAYGCLVDGKTVCSGYAKAFQLIMRELGYDCSYVTGEAGEAHGWNCVYLNGEGYYVDITWDDYDYEPDLPMYNYAFITTNSLEKTHTVDMMFDAPICNATDFNYFKYYQYYTDVYDFDAVATIFNAQSGEGALHVQFGSVEELGKAYQDLIEYGKFKKISALKNAKSYSYNESHYTFTFILGT